MTIRQKILIMGIVSILGMTYVLWLQYKSYSTQVSAMDVIRQNDLAVDALSLVVHELQKERGLTTVAQARAGMQDLAAQFHDTDIALAKLSGTGFDTKALQQSLLELRSQARERYDQLALRDSYTQLIHSLINSIGYLIPKPGAEALSRGISAQMSLILAKEYLGQIRATLGYGIEHGRRERVIIQSLAQLKKLHEEAIRKFRLEAHPDLLDMFDKQFSGQEIERLQHIIALAIDNAPLPDGLDAQAWWSMATLGVNRLQAVENKSLDLLQQKAEAEIQQLRNSMQTGAIITAGVCLLIIMLVVSVTLTLLRSVDKVHSSIEKIMGSGNFQVRIPVDSRDEIGKISHGFNELLDMMERLVHDITERKAREDAMALHKQVVETALDGFLLMDTLGNLLEANTAYTKISGYTLEELRQMHISQLETGKSPEELKAQLAEVVAHGSSRHEARHRCKDGRMVDMEVASTFIAGTNQLFVFCRNITEQKAAEQALQLYKSVIDITHDGFWIVDARGNLQIVNQAAANISGYSMKEMMSMHISQLEAIERSPDDVKAHMEKIIARGFDRFETRHIHKNGHEIDIEVVTSYLPETQQFAAFVRDISERKRIEGDLRASHERYDRLTTNIPIGVYQARSTSSGDIYFQYVSARFCSLLGLVPRSVYADAAVAFQPIHPDELADFVRLNQIAMQTHEPFKWEGRILVKGADRWVRIESLPEILANGECLWDGVIADITERKRAEEELKQTKERYDYASEIGKVGTWDWLPETGHLVWNNETFRLLGIEPNSVPPSFDLFMEVVHPEDREFIQNSVQAALNENKPYALDCRLVTGNDKVTFCHIEGKVDYDAEGKPVRMLGTIQDITGHKQAQIELQHKQDLLNEAQRLGQLGSWELNLISGKLFWSDEVYRIFELDPARFAPSYENFLGVVHPDDLKTVNEAYTRSLEDRQPYDIVHRLRMADGRIKWVREHSSTDFDASGKPLRSVGAVQDITKYKLAEDELRIAAVAFDTDEAILITDANSNITRVNKAFTRITGYEPEEVLGKNPRILSSGRMSMEFYAHMWKDLLSAGTWSGEIWDRRKSGEIYPKWLTITAVKNQEDHITEFVAMFSDITARKKAEEEIRNLAFYDALTGLPNRRLLMDRFQLALSVSDRNLHYGAVLFLDMDKFKTLNDTLGHDHGDLMLLDVAKRIQSCVREADTVARLGGDEFVVLLEGIGISEEEASQKAAVVAEKIRQALSDTYQLNGHECHSSPSIGVCLFRGYKESIDSLLKHADVAMYQAKEAGRNTVRFFDPAMQQLVQVRAALEGDLRHAITGNQLLLHYQIQVDSDIKPIGAEALVRWVHPKRGIVSPAQFIPVAEDSSLILEIGQWVLDTACQQLAIWSRHEQACNLELSINVSAKQFGQPAFVQQVEEAIIRHDVIPERLKLELTESVVLKDVTDVINKMHALKAIGIKLSLDDFGTGYSSLAYLKKLPLDQIKIDQSFVRDATSDPNDAVMIKTIIDMAQNFRLNVIAEGVETAAQLAFLRESGCMAYQGFLFGRPVPVEEFEAVVRGLYE